MGISRLQLFHVGSEMILSAVVKINGLNAGRRTLSFSLKVAQNTRTKQHKEPLSM